MNRHVLPQGFEPPPWNGDDLTLPAEALRVPTMLTEEEGRFLYWLTASYANGEGAVVDLGCFAGGSTARLAAGLAEAGNQSRIHAYDFFRLSEAQKSRYLYPAGIEPFEGRDMRPAVEQLLAPWRERVTLHEGDIGEAKWGGGPIGILFVDAAKRPSVADHIARVFFPHLVPGRSIVVHQDYQHWRQPWVPAQMELLADHFECVGWCRNNTVAFRPTRTLDDSALARASTEQLGDDDLIRLLTAAAGRFTVRAPRAAIARGIMALEDNPGVRVPQHYDSSRFSPERVRRVLAGM